MSIVFDRVSFTYSDPERTEKQRRRDEKRAKREEKREEKRAARKKEREKKKASESTFGNESSNGPENGEARKAVCPRCDDSNTVASTNASAIADTPAAWGTSPTAEWALRNISFSLEDGEFFGIAGHTGSGKSTLIQHMNGLANPTQGRVLVNGSDLSNKKAAQAARGHIGIVFQYPEHQLFAATVYDDVAFGPRNLGLSEHEVKARVQQALQSVQLDFDEFQDKSPFELSGGQQRRAAFAGVLAMNPEVLVLDEPVAGLDPQARNEFLDLIASLHARGITVVMVSHNMDDLARLCNRILILKEGEIFALGTPAEVFSHAEELHAIGLDVPAPQKLANSLRSVGFPLPERLYNTEALVGDLANLYQTHSQDSKAKAEASDGETQQREPQDPQEGHRPQRQRQRQWQPQNPQETHHA